METYQEELSQFKRWMKKQNFNTFEELQALIIFGDYGYAEVVRCINAAQQKNTQDDSDEIEELVSSEKAILEGEAYARENASRHEGENDV